MATLDIEKLRKVRGLILPPRLPQGRCRPRHCRCAGRPGGRAAEGGSLHPRSGVRGQAPATERQLEDAKRGELRWSEREQGWEVFIPACAFKNATSSYFGSKPFRLVLPDLGSLCHDIDAYIDRHRKVLLRGASDPRTFFLKSVKAKTADPATHILKVTGSYEQASYAILDTPEMVASHYGRFLPQDKAALAAQILNRVWEAA